MLCLQKLDQLRELTVQRISVLTELCSFILITGLWNGGLCFQVGREVEIIRMNTLYPVSMQFKSILSISRLCITHIGFFLGSKFKMQTICCVIITIMQNPTERQKTSINFNYSFPFTTNHFGSLYATADCTESRVLCSQRGW